MKLRIETVPVTHPSKTVKFATNMSTSVVEKQSVAPFISEHGDELPKIWPTCSFAAPLEITECEKKSMLILVKLRNRKLRARLRKSIKSIKLLQQ